MIKKIFNKDTPLARMGLLLLSSPIISGHYVGIRLSRGAIFTASIIMGLPSPALSVTVLSEDSCGRIRSSVDSYINKSGMLSSVCLEKGSPLEGGSPPLGSVDIDLQSLAGSTEAANAARASVDFVTSTLVAREKLAQCAYSRRDEIDEPVYRFKLSSFEQVSTIANYSSLVAGAEVREGSLRCDGVIIPVAHDLCVERASLRQSPALIAVFLNDVRLLIAQAQKDNDEAAGAMTIGQTRCAGTEEEGYLGASVGQLVKMSNSISAKSIEVDAVARQGLLKDVEAARQHGERSRLNRLYMNFMQERRDKIQIYNNK